MSYDVSKQNTPPKYFKCTAKCDFVGDATAMKSHIKEHLNIPQLFCLRCKFPIHEDSDFVDHIGHENKIVVYEPRRETPEIDVFINNFIKETTLKDFENHKSMRIAPAEPKRGSGRLFRMSLTASHCLSYNSAFSCFNQCAENDAILDLSGQTSESLARPESPESPRRPSVNTTPAASAGATSTDSRCQHRSHHHQQDPARQAEIAPVPMTQKPGAVAARSDKMHLGVPGKMVPAKKQAPATVPPLDPRREVDLQGSSKNTVHDHPPLAAKSATVPPMASRSNVAPAPVAVQENPIRPSQPSAPVPAKLSHPKGSAQVATQQTAPVSARPCPETAAPRVLAPKSAASQLNTPIRPSTDPVQGPTSIQQNLKGSASTRVVPAAIQRTQSGPNRPATTPVSAPKPVVLQQNKPIRPSASPALVPAYVPPNIKALLPSRPRPDISRPPPGAPATIQRTQSAQNCQPTAPAPVPAPDQLNFKTPQPSRPSQEASRPAPGAPAAIQRTASSTIRPSASPAPVPAYVPPNLKVLKPSRSSQDMPRPASVAPAAIRRTQSAQHCRPAAPAPVPAYIPLLPKFPQSQGAPSDPRLEKPNYCGTNWSDASKVPPTSSADGQSPGLGLLSPGNGFESPKSDGAMEHMNVLRVVKLRKSVTSQDTQYPEPITATNQLMEVDISSAQGGRVDQIPLPGNLLMMGAQKRAGQVEGVQDTQRPTARPQMNLEQAESQSGQRQTGQDRSQAPARGPTVATDGLGSALQQESQKSRNAEPPRPANGAQSTLSSHNLYKPTSGGQTEAHASSTQDLTPFVKKIQDMFPFSLTTSLIGQDAMTTVAARMQSRAQEAGKVLGEASMNEESRPQDLPIGQQDVIPAENDAIPVESEERMTNFGEPPVKTATELARLASATAMNQKSRPQPSSGPHDQATSQQSVFPKENDAIRVKPAARMADFGKSPVKTATELARLASTTAMHQESRPQDPLLGQAVASRHHPYSRPQTQKSRRSQQSPALPECFYTAKKLIEQILPKGPIELVEISDDEDAPSPIQQRRNATETSSNEREAVASVQRQKEQRQDPKKPVNLPSLHPNYKVPCILADDDEEVHAPVRTGSGLDRLQQKDQTRKQSRSQSSQAREKDCLAQKEQVNPAMDRFPTGSGVVRQQNRPEQQNLSCQQGRQGQKYQCQNEPPRKQSRSSPVRSEASTHQQDRLGGHNQDAAAKKRSETVSGLTNSQQDHLGHVEQDRLGDNGLFKSPVHRHDHPGQAVQVNPTEDRSQTGSGLARQQDRLTQDNQDQTNPAKTGSQNATNPSGPASPAYDTDYVDSQLDAYLAIGIQQPEVSTKTSSKRQEDSSESPRHLHTQSTPSIIRHQPYQHPDLVIPNYADYADYAITEPESRGPSPIASPVYETGFFNEIQYPKEVPEDRSRGARELSRSSSDMDLVSSDDESLLPSCGFRNCDSSSHRHPRFGPLQRGFPSHRDDVISQQDPKELQQAEIAREVSSDDVDDYNKDPDYVTPRSADVVEDSEDDDVTNQGESEIDDVIDQEQEDSEAGDVTERGESEDDDFFGQDQETEDDDVIDQNQEEYEEDDVTDEELEESETDDVTDQDQEESEDDDVIDRIHDSFDDVTAQDQTPSDDDDVNDPDYHPPTQRRTSSGAESEEQDYPRHQDSSDEDAPAKPRPHSESRYRFANISLAAYHRDPEYRPYPSEKAKIGVYPKTRRCVKFCGDAVDSDEPRKRRRQESQLQNSSRSAEDRQESRRCSQDSEGSQDSSRSLEILKRQHPEARTSSEDSSHQRRQESEGSSKNPKRARQTSSSAFTALSGSVLSNLERLVPREDGLGQDHGSSRKSGSKEKDQVPVRQGEQEQRSKSRSMEREQENRQDRQYQQAHNASAPQSATRRLAAEKGQVAPAPIANRSRRDSSSSSSRSSSSSSSRSSADDRSARPAATSTTAAPILTLTELHRIQNATQVPVPPPQPKPILIERRKKLLSRDQAFAKRNAERLAKEAEKAKRLEDEKRQKEEEDARRQEEEKRIRRRKEARRQAKHQAWLDSLSVEERRKFEKEFERNLKERQGPSRSN